MKKIISSIFLILICYLGYSQTYPVTQNLGNTATTKVKTNALEGKLIITAFTDTVAANTEGYLKNYDGAIIKTTSPINALWYRVLDSAKWVQLLPLGGGTGGTRSWLDGGNFNVLADGSGNAVWGTLQNNGIKMTTNATTRLLLDKGGIVRSSGAANKFLTFDTTTKTMYYTDGASASDFWSTIGNSGTTPPSSFIGTTDAVGLMFKVNNTQAGYIDRINGNTSFGYEAALNNPTGADNTAIGEGAMKTSTTISLSVAVGQNALIANDGTQNVAVGNDVLTGTGSGSNNTAVGYNSMALNTSGQFNTSIGASSLNVNTIGIENVVVGAGSGSSVTTGSHNVIVGTGAGQISTGQSNTILGDSTGLGITTGNYNTILGSKVTGLSSSLSNNIILADGQGNQRLQFDASGNPYLPYTTSAANAADSMMVILPGTGKVGYRAIPTSSGGTVTGSGTTNYIPKWSSSTALGNSQITDDGSNITASINTGTFSINSTAYSNLFSTSNTNGTINIGDINTDVNGTQIVLDDNTQTIYLQGNTGINTSPTVALDVVGDTKLTSSATTTTGLDVSSSTITSGALATFTNTGTAAASNTKTVGKFYSSGANATSTQTTYAIDASNTNTGTSSTNVALRAVATGGSNNYAALFTGNVGIGTSAPLAPLNILNTSEALRVSYDASNYSSFSTSSSGNMLLGVNGTNKWGMSVSDGGTLYAVTGGTYNIGFDGTNSPKTIYAGSTGANNAFKGYLADATTSSLANAASVLVLRNTNTTANNFVKFGLNANDNGATERNAVLIGAQVTARSAGSITADLIFSTANAAAADEKMRIMSSGNVGIGTTSPTAKLEVAGNATTGNDLLLTNSTLTTGSAASIALTGTAAASNTKTGLSITSSGANGTASQTVTGQTISVTNIGTTNTNVGLNVTASGASTRNTAIQVTSGIINFAGTGTAALPNIKFGASANATGFYDAGVNNINVVANANLVGSWGDGATATTGFWVRNTGNHLRLVNATYLTSPSDAVFKFGLADAAAPVAQNLKTQNVVAGTSNTAGVNLTIDGSQGTGTGVGGSILFRTAAAGSTGTAVNALATTLTISPTAITAALPVTLMGYTVATLPTGVTGMIATVNDSNTNTWGATIAGSGANTVLAFFNGTNWTVIGQ